MAVESKPEMRSLSPDQIFTKLELSHEGLEDVRTQVEAGNHSAALNALLAHYRRKYPLDPPTGKASEDQIQTADNIVRHIFQWGPYEPADYGAEVRWEWDPADDIEWVAAIYRFYWAQDLVIAYRATHDDKYAQAFVELTADWIEKHPLEDQGRVHYIYGWGNYPWLDIQTGIRASRICDAFPVLIHGESFTPEFLGLLLASLYDHQTKTELDPMGIVHNKAIFEQRGFAQIAETFPEFRDSARWMRMALDTVIENLTAQTTEDGVQREWCGGYHLAVMSDGMEMIKRADDFGIEVPPGFRERIRRMNDYMFAVATPELSWPIFGDTKRPRIESADRSDWFLYPALQRASRVYDEPRFAARADLDREVLPDQTSYAFQGGGLYVMRDQWGPEQVYFALHCPPPGIGGHDQPDNGTFELHAFGQWLMNDTGFYTYGHDNEARNWHRLTRLHQTLTLDNRDTAIEGEQLLWASTADHDVLTVQNRSYPDLTHRRTVWFVDRRFFVILDEAMGNASGTLRLHYQFSPGEVEIDTATHRAVAMREDAGLLLWQAPDAPVEMVEEPMGYHAWDYGVREPRTAVHYRHHGSSPASFVTVLAPFRGTSAPTVAATIQGEFQPGQDAVHLHVEMDGQRWTLSRNLANRTAEAVIEE